MTLRTNSRGQQWTVWLLAFLAGLAIYVILSRVLYGSMNWNVFAPLQQRIALPLLVLLYLIASETRWDGVKRDGEEVKGEDEQRNLASDPGCAREVTSTTGEDGRAREVTSTTGEDGALSNRGSQTVVRVTHAHTLDGCAREVTSTTEKTDLPCSLSPPTVDAALAPGEAEYIEARAMPHQPIPDYEMDGEYLKLLTQSAAKGYPTAMAKLGEYAMRRGCTVEAYYWLWRAKRAGMGNLDRKCLIVRNAWARGGFRRESMNEYEYFTRIQGTIGYALLCIDSGHNAIAAKERLAECAPEFLLGS